MKTTAATLLGIALALAASIPAQAQSPAQATSQASRTEVALLLEEAQSLAEDGHYGAAMNKLNDARTVSTSQNDVAAISAVKQFILFKARQLPPQL